MPQLSEGAMKKAEAAKKYIENQYRLQEKRERERNERYSAVYDKLPLCSHTID